MTPEPNTNVTWTKSDANTAFGQRLQWLRKLHGYTQRNLGELVGVKQTTISNYEQGLVTPNAETVRALEEVLFDSARILSNALTGNPMAESQWKERVTVPTEEEMEKARERARRDSNFVSLLRRYLRDNGLPDNVSGDDVDQLIRQWVASATESGGDVVLEHNSSPGSDMTLKIGDFEVQVDFKSLPAAKRRPVDQRRQELERSLRQAKSALQQTNLAGANTKGLEALLTTLTNRVTSLEQEKTELQEAARRMAESHLELAELVGRLVSATSSLSEALLKTAGDSSSFGSGESVRPTV